MIWDDLGFAVDYSVEPDPDYPGDGVWGHPRVGIATTESVLARGPVALIRPDASEPWLLEAEIPKVGGIYGTPDPDAFCYFDRFTRVVIVRASSPHSQLPIDADPVSIAAARDEQLLLIGGHSTVTAWSREGLVWRSEWLFDDDLHIRRTDNGRIVCRGRNDGDIRPSEVTLDAATGRTL